MPFSDYADDMVLKHMLGLTSWTMPAGCYTALGSDAAPAKTVFTEIVTAGTLGYARQTTVFNSPGTDGITENSALLTFGPDTTTNWGTLKSFAIYDAVTAGNRLTQGALTDQTKVVNIGDSATIAIGAIIITAT